MEMASDFLVAMSLVMGRLVGEVSMSVRGGGERKEG